MRKLLKSILKKILNDVGINILIRLNEFYASESVKFMKENVPDNFVDLIVTSPPYDSIRDYNGFVLDLHSIGEQSFRILKDGGIFVMVIQDQTKDFGKSLTSFHTIVDWCDSIGFKLFECCIYQRSGIPGNWWSKRFRVDHEYIPIFIKGKRPKCFTKEHMMIECKNEGVVKKGKCIRNTEGELIDYDFTVGSKKCCGTIINYESARNSEKYKSGVKYKHPATFPDKLAEDFILCFSNEEDIVYDPMCGSGTTCAMTYKNNRQFIGTDISEEYINNICVPRLKEYG